ncbi:MAG: hypothetical protein JNN08_00890 [Bryobacterales bacterium]|nr:hypothetical protein [Bryobacterales bacterium]
MAESGAQKHDQAYQCRAAGGTIRVLDRVAPEGSRSRLISEAVLYYVENRAKSNLSDKLKAGAQANARRDLEIAQEWFSLDEEAWQPTPAPKRTK